MWPLFFLFLLFSFFFRWLLDIFHFSYGENRNFTTVKWSSSDIIFHDLPVTRDWRKKILNINNAYYCIIKNSNIFHIIINLTYLHSHKFHWTRYRRLYNYFTPMFKMDERLKDIRFKIFCHKMRMYKLKIQCACVYKSS